MNGLFIVFEGPEGSGKSTQAKQLAASIGATGRDVVLTREPGGTAIGEKIRSVLLDRANHDILPRAEALLYAADRAQHVGSIIGPALKRGAVVVCDRFVDSTYAYQAAGRGLPIGELLSVQQFATEGLQPDLRILLDLPIEVGLARRHRERETVNRLDAADLSFHQRVRASYLELARRDEGTWEIVDAQMAPDLVRRHVWNAVAGRLGIPPIDTTIGHER